LQYWGLKSGPIPWAFSVSGIFQNRVLRTICLGWLRTTILLISASWVARIIGASHRYLAIISNLPPTSLCRQTWSRPTVWDFTSCLCCSYSIRCTDFSWNFCRVFLPEYFSNWNIFKSSLTAPSVHLFVPKVINTWPWSLAQIYHTHTHARTHTHAQVHTHINNFPVAYQFSSLIYWLNLLLVNLNV
jgi:hypothetical protein